MKNILETANAISDKIIEHRRKIHSKPELSFKEFETCKYICDVLDGLKIPYQIVCDTGVVATIGNIDSMEKNDNCIAFRADIDALPITENTGLSFSSQNEGVMHACGHDMHIAMLLGAAEILKADEKKLNGIVKLIFQPGEELLPGGAKLMIENGVLENPKPQMIFAQHINPNDEVGKISTVNGAVMAATCEIYWTIKGKGTHAAQPQQGNDPIIVAANIISFVQSFVIRYQEPLAPTVLAICSINGGTANNVFPDEVKMSGTLRALSEETRNELLKLLTDKCQQIASSYGTECDIEVIYGYPPVINDSAAVEVVKDCVKGLLGSENFSFCESKMLAEDFAYFAKEIPSCFYFIGGKTADADICYPLHSAKFNPDEKVLAKGTALIVAITKKLLQA